MNSRLQAILIFIVYILAGAGSFVGDADLTRTGIGIAGVVCAIFYFMKFGRELVFLLRHVPEHAGFIVVQGLLASLIPLTSSAAAAICWSGLFVMEFLRYTQAKQQLQMQETIQKVNDKQQEQNESFRRIRSERHDFLKHVNVIQYLLNEKKFEEANDYFSELLQEYEETNASIKGEEGHIAAILVRYKRDAEMHDVQADYDLRIPLSYLPMKMIDQAKLISNLLANSVEAASAYRQHGRKSAIQVRTSSCGGIFVLEIINHTLPIPKETADHIFRRFAMSSKGAGHEGMGTYIIAKLVGQYNGILSYKYEHDIFSVKIKIPIVKDA
ncbi:sensor histidine kinase [Ectobacillus panaciterrae]|uniref:sensor histidine kinase n=1 Tax=Ectobacillus panaciterrae TaxID=363872 RepID=UPI0004132090|nr:GHKL domain-containing protein [Ectobacillus panaciterrae]